MSKTTLDTLAAKKTRKDCFFWGKKRINTGFTTLHWKNAGERDTWVRLVGLSFYPGSMLLCHGKGDPRRFGR